MLIDHALDRVSRCETKIANTHYRADQMRAHLAQRGVEESHEPVLLDMGGGLKQAIHGRSLNAIVTANTDAVWTGPEPLDLCSAVWNPKVMDALMVLVPTTHAIGHHGQGDFDLDRNGTIKPGREYVYTGLQCIASDPILQIDETVFPIQPIWRKLMSQERLFGVVHKGGWCDVGRPESIALAEDMLARQQHV